MKKFFVGAVVGVCFLINSADSARSQEFSIIQDSTVIGRNFGYPSGTPIQGQTPVGEIDLVFESLVFFKDLELTGFDSSTNINGETFFGFLLPVRGRYRAHDQLTFELGAVVGQDFGDEDALNIAEPLLRLVYEPVRKVFLVAGTILPTHWVHDALLDDVRKFRINAEQGIQIRADRSWLKNDTWINWRVRESDIRAEEFEVGQSAQVRFLEEALWLDGQFFWVHVGGQKNTTNRVENNIGLLGGGSYGFRHPFRVELIEEVRIGGNFLLSRDSARARPNVTGHGHEVFAIVDARPTSNIFLRLLGSFFDGDDFLARSGDPLYGLDQYGQLGTAVLFILPAGIRIETSIVGQFNDDLLNYTFAVNFAWGQAFVMNFLRPRSTQSR